MRSRSFLLIFFLTAQATAQTVFDPKLQAIFEQGMSAAYQGNYETAAAAFRKMLKDHPELPRPRLELALALYKNGDYRAAKYHFEQVSRSALPPAARQKVRNFLALIRERLPSLKLSAALLADTNPRHKSATDTINIGGFDFVLDDNEKRRAFGYQIALDGKIPLAAENRIFAKIGLEHQNYENDDNAQTWLKATIGKHFSTARATLTPEVGAHQFIYQHKKYYSGRRLSLQYFQPLDGANFATINWNYGQFHYPDFNHQNGEQYGISARWTILPATDRRLELESAYLKFNAADEANGYHQNAFALSRTRDFKGGWTLGFGGRWHKKRHEARSPFFAEARRENQISIEISILNRNFQIGGLAPKLSVGRIENDTNIDLYDFDKSYVKIEFSERF